MVEGILTKFNNNTIFNLFNYKKYMLSKNTYYKIYNPKIKLISENTNILYKIKNRIIRRINIFQNKEYLYAFLLGDNTYIDENILLSFRINGISHLFSVSGMHVSFLATILLYILNKIKKSKLNYILIILFLTFFSFLTNFSSSIIRSVLLYIFIILNKCMNLNVKTYKLLLYIFIITLFINPYNMYNVGYIFSYIISLYLILFSSIINKYNNYFIKIFFSSFISFIVSIPILINNYFSINLLTILNNIIFVPLISLVIFPITFIVIFVPKLEFIYNILINMLEFLSSLFNKFKLEITLCKVNFFIIIIYYIVISLILYKIRNKKYNYVLILIILLLVHSNLNKFNNNLYINFVDVGQGDSTLIKFSHNSTSVLIDTGGNYKYNISNNTISYLKSVGMQKLDYLILSHGDFDHMGEAKTLVENFKVKNVIFNCGSYNELEQELIKVLNKKKIKYYSCIKELNIDKYKLQFLNTKDYVEENDNSNVIYFNYNGHKFLFMGDAGVEKEKDILEKYNLKDIDFLKVGHHGSNTSSSEYFIKNVNPKYSLISVGKNNRYGHPKDEVLETLKNSKIYRTDLDGSIEIKLNKNGYKIRTCSS